MHCMYFDHLQPIHQKLTAVKSDQRLVQRFFCTEVKAKILEILAWSAICYLLHLQYRSFHQNATSSNALLPHPSHPCLAQVNLYFKPAVV